MDEPSKIHCVLPLVLSTAVSDPSMADRMTCGRESKGEPQSQLREASSS